MTRLETSAYSVGQSRTELRRQLLYTRSMLKDEGRRIFTPGHWDLKRRRLLSNDGQYALQWRMRERPDLAESYNNRQTSKGTVVIGPTKELNPPPLSYERISAKWRTRYGATLADKYRWIMESYRHYKLPYKLFYEKIIPELSRRYGLTQSAAIDLYAQWMQTRENPSLRKYTVRAYDVHGRLQAKGFAGKTLISRTMKRKLGSMRGTYVEFKRNPGNIGFPRYENYDTFKEYVSDLTLWIGVDELDPAHMAQERRRFEAAKRQNPMANFHSVRLRPPDYSRWGYSRDFLGRGIDVVWGIKIKGKKRKVEMQALRFRKDTFSITQVRDWLRKHPKFEYETIEAARRNPGWLTVLAIPGPP